MTVKVERSNLNRKTKSEDSIAAENEKFLLFLIEQTKAFKKFENIEFSDANDSQFVDLLQSNSNDEVEPSQVEESQNKNLLEKEFHQKTAIVSADENKKEKIEKIETKSSAGVIDKRKKK